MVRVDNFKVNGLKTAIEVSRIDGTKSDSGLCKAGNRSVTCENCANNYDLFSGKDGFCQKSTYDNKFMLGLGDAKRILKSRGAKLCVRTIVTAVVGHNFGIELLDFFNSAYKNNTFRMLDTVQGLDSERIKMLFTASLNDWELLNGYFCEKFSYLTDFCELVDDISTFEWGWMVDILTVSRNQGVIQGFLE